MKLRFLCGAHREELSSKPRQAINCWQDGFDTGQILCDQRQWKEALPHLGCAFETSEIIMTSKVLDSQSACELFISSARLLADTFLQLNYVNQAREIYQVTIKRLERNLICIDKNTAYIKQQLSTLYKNLQVLNEVRMPLINDGPVTHVNQRNQALH